MLGSVEGLRVLDLFAGSGALGIEAASRGAAALTLVETDRRALESIRHNLDAVGLEAEVVRRDALAYLSASRRAASTSYSSTRHIVPRAAWPARSPSGFRGSRRRRPGS